MSMSLLMCLRVTVNLSLLHAVTRASLVIFGAEHRDNCHTVTDIQIDTPTGCVIMTDKHIIG